MLKVHLAEISPRYRRDIAETQKRPPSSFAERQSTYVYSTVVKHDVCAGKPVYISACEPHHYGVLDEVKVLGVLRARCRGGFGSRCRRDRGRLRTWCTANPVDSKV
jgi:hypothetical protein